MKSSYINTLMRVVLLSSFIVSLSVAKDTFINANPSYVVFQSVASAQETTSSTISITNDGYTSGVTISDVTLEGSHSSDFNLTSNGCTTLALNESCSVGVKFKPTTSGVKSAVLSVAYGSGSEKLSIFLTNYESTALKAKNTLPPVMSALSISEEMNASSSYDLNWSAMGYHDDYAIIMVMFDCTGLAAGTCGSSYGSSEKFYESAPLSASTTSVGDWSSNGVVATNFNYTHSFSVPATRVGGSAWSDAGTPIVIRFYNKSSEDSIAGNPSISLIIPGGLSNDYYDTSGRKVQKIICPASGCN